MSFGKITSVTLSTVLVVVVRVFACVRTAVRLVASIVLAVPRIGTYQTTS